MNSSLQVNPGTTTPVECLIYDVVGGVPQHFSTQAYTVIVINIFIIGVTCPFTVLLNLLTMITVKMKARLQRMSNIALACLATTDLMVGVLGQPFYIPVAISALQCQATSEVCRLQNFTKYSLNIFSFALHFIGHQLFLTVQSSLGVVLMVLITTCSIVVYFEARRHEREIAVQQVSVEARERFLKERRALRLTITVVVMIILNYLPTISFRTIRRVLKDKISLGALYALYFTASSFGILNSLINPLIYTVRLRQFRVAFIEILLKKNHAEAEEFEMRLFAVVNFVPNQGGEGEEQRVDKANANTNQGGEREEQNVNQVKANINIETEQGGE